jgi:transposase
LRAAPDVPGVPSAEELSTRPHGELAGRLAEAYTLIGELTVQAGRVQARVEELERQARRDSSVSWQPPSSDSPYRKKQRDRSLRERGQRQPGITMSLAGDPDKRLGFSPACCRGCGADLAGEPAAAECRHQVTDIVPPPRRG